MNESGLVMDGGPAVAAAVGARRAPGARGGGTVGGRGAGRRGAAPALDPVTGLVGRKGFAGRLQAEAEAARRSAWPLSVVVLDIDRFGQVNGLHGRGTGDGVLAEVAARLAVAAPAGASVARLDGDAFAWLLPAVDGARAHAAAEAARRAVGSRPFAGVGDLTASAGVGQLGAPAADAGEMLRLARAALRWAKGRGRDLCLRYSVESARAFAAVDGRCGPAAIDGIRALAEIVDGKSPATRGHSERVAVMAEALAGACAWPAARAAQLREVGLVHDVGKIGMPDAILLKPGPLDPDERRRIRLHPGIGARVVRGVLSDEQAAWLRHHHERFDGAGYPDGLRGNEIPFGARLLALADAWDAMTSNRVYQSARTPVDALGEVRREAGRHFCPQAVGALTRLWALGLLPPSGGG
ncbi:MAG: hypothetical protein QOD86_1610 [Miltoncostaeaceae bacterium]|nr:hypothetical protein [Miltoncostaeaceae bacterium]